MNALVVIPARLHSTRLPGKMLLAETGKLLLQHTWEQARLAKRATDVLVATDSEEILRAVRGFGGKAMRTSEQHPSGTDRIAEVAGQLPGFEIIVNVQGDEPELDPANIDRAIDLLQRHPSADMATLAAPIFEPEMAVNPSIVKVVVDAANRALWFSRSLIPFLRDGSARDLPAGAPSWLQHIGLYVYRRDVLLELTRLPRPAAEVMESLEQLRALHFGKSILVEIVERSWPGIDTREDYEAFVSRCRH